SHFRSNTLNIHALSAMRRSHSTIDRHGWSAGRRLNRVVSSRSFRPPRTMVMSRRSGIKVGMGIVIAALTASGNAAPRMPTPAVDPSRLHRLGTIDERFQSYNVEMVEVTGGRFWKPYRASASAPPVRDADNAGNAPAGSNPDLYAYRQPIDLSNPRLRALAA